MRRTIIILSLLLLAAPLYADDQIPIDYDCKFDPQHPAEAKFCIDLYDALGATGLVDLDISDDAVYFDIIVLPTERGGYIALTMHASFRFPPLQGFALSAFTWGIIIEPGSPPEAVNASIAAGIVNGVSQWMVDSHENLGVFDNCAAVEEFVLETTP
jgi:hypothetical protein